MTFTVRDVTPADEPVWRSLWDGYCAFYEKDMPADVTDATWQRILDPGNETFGAIVAERDGSIVGFANYVLQWYTWSTGQQCYLHDLFVDPEVRGGGVGEALIRFLQRRGAERGWTRVHWLTHESNDRARRLYDRFTPASGFIQYVVPVREDA
jgi:GNAT superfamily N-acetyltransferase